MVSFGQNGFAGKPETERGLSDKAEELYSILENCELCPHRCRVNRRHGEKGICRAPDKAVVCSYQPHFGEERPLVGSNGSGTIFFSHCTLRCVFCQNYDIAHEGMGTEVSDEELADMMLHLQKKGCHNINLVTPTHVLPNIINAARIAYKKGLSLPLCYNTNGYDRAEIIKLLDGVVDIYLPDMKFMDDSRAEGFFMTEAPDYTSMAQEALLEMHRQVGHLATDYRGVALSGLMIRHLVMPNRLSGTREFVYWVAENLSTETYVNIMAQYRPEFKAFAHDEISRTITHEEFVEAVEWAMEAGLTNLDGDSMSQYYLT